MPSNFLKIFFFSFLCMLLLGLCINGICLYYQLDLPDSFKQALISESTKTNTLLLGSSRVRYIRPNSPSWEASYTPVVSIFSTMESVPRMKEHLVHSIQFSKPQKAFIFIDFFTFNVYNQGPPDAQKLYFLKKSLPNLTEKPIQHTLALAQFKIERSLKYLFSLSNIKHNIPILYSFIRFKGPPAIHIPPLDQRVSLLENWMMDETFFISPGKKFTYQKEDGVHTIFDDFSCFLDILYKNNIEATIVINPFHVRIFELVHASGLWPYYKEWLEGVVLAVENSSIRANKKAFSLLDFSGYSPYNTEVFDLNNNTEPKWYMESSHFNNKLGDILIRTLCRYHENPKKNLDWGIKLNSKNVSEHIAKLEEDRHEYIQKHPELSNQIMAIYKRWKHTNELLNIRKSYQEASSL